MKQHRTIKSFVIALTTLCLVTTLTMPALGIAQVYSTTAVVATLNSQLSTGSRGSDVTNLQTFLARDASIYPEGLVTGFYGSLTAAAVTRFQLAHNLPGVGRVGPLTLSLINSMILGGGNSTSDIIAPTMYNINVSPYSSSGTYSPLGTQLYYPQNQTTITYPSGTSCPIPSTGGTSIGYSTTTNYQSGTITCSVSPSGMTSTVTSYPLNTALASKDTIISWSTSEQTTGKVFYGPSFLSEVEGVTPIISGNVATDNNTSTSHTIVLSNLTPGTTYYYVVESTDTSGNVSVTNQTTFIAR